MIAPAAGVDPQRAKAVYNSIRQMPLPFMLLDHDRRLWVANQALANIFEYKSIEEVEQALSRHEFLVNHFSTDVQAQFLEQLYTQGIVRGWLMAGQTLSGRDLVLEVTARASLLTAQGPVFALEAIWVLPADIRDVEVFQQKAKHEASLSAKAKNEFLSNISHELRTPLNIIMGMLELAQDEPEAGADLKENLALALEAAVSLNNLLNDLILLSNLEARRLVSESSIFSLELLFKTLSGQFTAKASAKNVTLELHSDQQTSLLLEGGYNFIIMALGKIVDNALKFIPTGGQVDLGAETHESADGLWLRCWVKDNGPGFSPAMLAAAKEGQNLFLQGDGSLSRLHGGLGLGLTLAAKLTAMVGGRLELANGEGGGALVSLNYPLRRFAEVEEA